MAKKKLNRSEELSTRITVRRELLKLFADVDKGYIDQRSRANDNIDYWDMYNCKLGERQFYSGNSQIFVPIVQNAIEARKTRFVNQVFPQNGRYVEATTPDGDEPSAIVALLDNYVRKAKLRTEVVPAMVKAGDVEGQYTLYVDWRETTLHQVWRRKKPDVQKDGLAFPDLGTTEMLEEEEVHVGRPHVEVIPDADLLVLPATCESIDDAIHVGGSVTLVRRWSKAAIKRMIKDGDCVKDVGEALIKSMSKKDVPGRVDTAKNLADAAGIKAGGGSKHVLGYETWTKLKVGDDYRLCRTYYGGEQQIMGCKRNPYWNDKVPVISASVDKSLGVFKGRSPSASVIDMQVFANDAINEAADTAHFSAMPIVMTDPEKNPRVGSMVLGLAAVWETSPKDTEFAKFPELWKHGFEIVGACKQEVFQTLGVNPSMMPQQTGGRQKRNQAEIAMEQQVDILTTADAVTVIEEAILSPLLQWFADLDYQFRDDEMLVRVFGEMGERAKMETIPPLEMDERYAFRWFGVEAARNAAQVQQQIAMANVFKGVPPQMYQGFQLDMAPLMVQLAENAFGPRLGPLIFKDLKKQLTVDPNEENGMLEHGFAVPVHPNDPDIEHLQAHMQAMQAEGGDPHGTFRAHIQGHMQQMQMKNQAQAKAMGQGQGGGGGGLQEGAQPDAGRGMRGPPGAINPDQMGAAGAVVPPRKT